MLRKPLKAAAKEVDETRRLRLREGFVLHQGRFVRRGGEVVEVTKTEFTNNRHKFEDGIVPPDDEAEA